jgi:hypothetical protein
MTTTASLDLTEVSLDPGSEAVVPIQIRNNGSIVEGYELAVIGPPGEWATVDPPTMSLYPGTTTTAAITFRPPRTARTVAGQHRFGVRVLPTEHPELAVVPEGVVEVLPFLETTAELVPHTSQGRTGRHQVAVDNRGNAPVNVLIAAQSDGEQLRFKLDQVGLAVQPGEARFVRVWAKADKRIWRGQPVTHPFVVLVTPQDSTPVELPGTYVQTPVVPKWLWWLVPLLIALAALLLALWFLVLQPTIESQAKEAAAAEADRAEEAAQDAEKAAEVLKDPAPEQGPGKGPGKGPDKGPDKGADKDPDDNPTPPKKRVVVTDISPRLHGTPADNDSATVPFELDDPSDTFALTDVVLSNPQGDFGRVELRVDGAVLLSHALENFRDLDFHFVSPIQVTEGVTMEVDCRTPGEPPDAGRQTNCDVAALLGGVLTHPVPRE